jgi:hypothetical protein
MRDVRNELIRAAAKRLRTKSIASGLAMTNREPLDMSSIASRPVSTSGDNHSLARRIALRKTRRRREDILALVRKGRMDFTE